MALGDVTNPEGTARLHEYWVHGAGAAKIRWGEPGDFDRCVMHLGKYIADPKGYCAKAHHDALGIWPATHAAMEKGRSMDDSAVMERAAMTSASINDLPDSAFAYIEPGGKVVDGKTEPRSKRHFPIHDAAHVRNALARASQSPFGAKAMPKIRAAAKRFGIDVSGSNSAEQAGEFRTVPFDVTSAQADGDGLTFEGYAAVYGQRARIANAFGDFDEQIVPGAFRSIAPGKYPALLFDHGRHPLIGGLPLGRITGTRDDSQGLWIEARLTDNWLIKPVRDAIADKAITGMSFRFTVNGEDGHTWETRADDVDLRTLRNLDVPELGPVVFPAYVDTTANVRSQFELPVIGRPAAGAGVASGREGGAGQRMPKPSISERFRADGEALAMRGIQGVRI